MILESQSSIKPGNLSDPAKVLTSGIRTDSPRLNPVSSLVIFPTLLLLQEGFEGFKVSIQYQAW